MPRKMIKDLKKRQIIEIGGQRKEVKEVVTEIWSSRLIVRFQDRSTKFFEPTDVVEVVR